MRILQVINALTLGGAQLLLVDLVRYSEKHGHQTEVVCFRNGSLANLLQDEGFKVHILGEVVCDFPAYFKLRKIIKDFKPDIIHSHLFRSSFWTRICHWLLPRAKLITSIHGVETRTFHRLERILGRISDALVFPSHFMLNWYQKNIINRKKCDCLIIYPGTRVYPLNTSRIKDENRKIYIGILSRLHPIKGIDRLIKACKDLSDKGIDYFLLIGGDGKQRLELENQAKDLGIIQNCQFFGEVTNQQDFLEKIDIFVAPSRQEAFGIYICEAMERGLPVIAANVGGIPEVIEHQKSGILFDADRKESLTEAIELLINSPQLRKRLGYTARKKIKSDYNRIDSLKYHFKLYESMREKNIHFAISSGELGGGERMALGLMCAMKKQGWKVRTTCTGNPLALAIREKQIPCQVVGMRCGGLFFALKMAKQMLMHSHIVNSHLNKASFISGFLGKVFGVPVLSHIHGLNRKNYYRFSNGLIAVSEAVKSHLSAQGFGIEQIVTIPNCIDKIAVTESRELVNKTFRIAITAKLHKNKGHKWALEAISRNIGQLGKLRIDIFGDGLERYQLEMLANRLGIGSIVTFHGFVDNPESYYSNIDMALLPSLGEGIPLSLLETMRLGIPCIASKTGGIPEIVKHGHNGLLIEPLDSDALIKAIKRMMQPEEYAKFSQNSIEYFSEINDYPRMVDKFEILVKKTANL